MKNWPIFDAFLIQISKQVDDFTFGYQKYNLTWNLLALDQDGRPSDINIMKQWLEWVSYGFQRNLYTFVTNCFKVTSARIFCPWLK